MRGHPPAAPVLALRIAAKPGTAAAVGIGAGKILEVDAGHDVQAVAEGSAAIRVVAQHQPVVLLDTGQAARNTLKLLGQQRAGARLWQGKTGERNSVCEGKNFA